MNGEKQIHVYADWFGNTPVYMGRLYAVSSRNKEIFSFEYDETWLKHCAQGKLPYVMLDPDLKMGKGRQYTPTGKLLFGMFSDSCPDRWGRLLMKRREAIQARKEIRKPHQLNESDFLLGVYDETRMGALRFSLEENGEFLSADKALATPPWTTLRTLESASLAFENSTNADEEKWLKQLLAPGSSLGGARPKATVQAPDGSLWIAKFPAQKDDWNIGAWEMVVHDLAVLCGLHVPEAKLQTFSKNGSTYLSKRFDRSGDKRIHFASAMTLLSRTDGQGSDGASYLDIADFITANGAKPTEDLNELWRRIVFGMTVSNTDDHLRNHGFILTENGWTLSPMYDVNPNIYGDTLSLNVGADDNSISYDLVREVAPFFGIDEQEAQREIQKITTLVDENWRRIATDYELSRSEIENMAPAFDLAFKS